MRRTRALFAALAAITLLCLRARGDATPAASAQPGAAAQTMADWVELRNGYDTEFDASADAGAGATARGQNLGSVSDRAFELDASRSIQLAPEWAASGGVRLADSHQSAGTSAPVPAELGSVGLPLDLRWRGAGAWGGVAELVPAFNGQNFQSSGADFDFSGSVVGLWQAAPGLLVAAGAEFDTFGSYPILPAGGIVYELGPEWTARILFPDPRIVYRCTATLSVYAGAHFQYGSYRVSRTLGDRYGLPRLDHALLSVEQTMYGPGLSWQPNRGVVLEGSAGVEADRHLDYFRAGYAVDLRAAAAFRLTFQVSF
jgi:hypothetical protein